MGIEIAVVIDVIRLIGNIQGAVFVQVRGIL
jgi:hypothetical protein